ncbi:MAG: hypothetical protein M3Z56_02150 [Bacteroidota bacterium]|nr:hypothetical protein [Bacteroidota bacterium]
MNTTFKLHKAFKFTLFIALIVSGFSCGSTRNSIAVEEGWDLLGETKAGFIRETDVINVNSRNQFTAIRFKVEGHGIKLSDLSIYFDNGDKLSPAVDETLAAGQESKLIELAADGRTISKIEFRYRTDGSILKGKARILVFGKRYRVGY